MYRYLDRGVGELDPSSTFLIAAMRVWVGTATQGRCPHTALHAPFVKQGVEAVLPDFGIVMAALNVDGLGQLHFGLPGCGSVGEDEAVLLALFAAGTAPDPTIIYRIAATLVSEDAVNYLARAAKLVATSLACTTKDRAGERP